MTSARWAVVIPSVAVVVAWRLFNADSGAPNVEIATAMALGLAYYLRDARAALAPLVGVGLADLVLGAGPVHAFTWSAWAVTGLAGWLVARRRPPGIGTSMLFGIASSTWFYVWTNAGVWFLGHGTFYPEGADGLFASLAAGLPFYRNMVVTNAFLVPAVVGVFRYLSAREYGGALTGRAALAGAQ